ncbi:ParB/RepB/Spo0J family partition protein [Coprobacillus cateniformis]|uniref:ParB/RepB/Spo0J family partition protein n=1 Tax=Coprobacillus cateniformis TaxID=100884 RepID=UPI00399FFBA2
MCKIERKIKNDTVTLSTRISRGFDKNGKRLRKRYSLKLDTNEYQTEKQQDQAFKDFLIKQGVNEIQFEEKENEDHKKTESEVFDKESDLAIVEDTQTNELTTRKIVKIPLEKLQVFELNPCRPSEEFIERLALSIYEDGLNNPIHVVKYKDKYLIQKGNKRYAAYQFLNKKYDSDYDKIECYILDYEIEDDKKEIDPMFTLQLMRDNINTYERTLNDKILEVELYHKIFPDLKKKGIASGRENEWIAKEMGVADKSVKDYLKLLKVDDVKKKFMNREVLTLDTALRMVDYYNQYGKDEYYLMIGDIRQKYNTRHDNDFAISYHMIEPAFWRKEREERERKAKELELQRKREKPYEPVEDAEVPKEEKEEYQIPTFNNYENLPHYYFETSLLEKIKISLEIEDINIKFEFLNQFDENKYFFEIVLTSYKNVLSIQLIRMPAEVKEVYWRYTCPNENKLFNINMECENRKVDIFKCMNNIDNILNKEKIVLTIDDKENFIASLLDNVLVEKEILEKED